MHLDVNILIFCLCPFLDVSILFLIQKMNKPIYLFIYFIYKNDSNNNSSSNNESNNNKNNNNSDNNSKKK